MNSNLVCKLTGHLASLEYKLWCGITLIKTLKEIWIHLLCVGFVFMCSCSDTGNMKVPYNSPGGCLVHVLFF